MKVHSLPYRFIDLFSGIGGFHLALHQLGMECVFASEINKDARKSYEKNFKKISPKLFSSGTFSGDIYKVTDLSIIPEFDVLCAGFPCQPFSQIGKKRGFSDNLDRRGNIFFEIERILRLKSPRAFLLENVEHLVSHDNGNTFSAIENSIKSLEYSFYHKVINASDFNLPQRRPRTYMVGFHKENNPNIEFKFPDPIPLKKDMTWVFGRKCEKKIGYTLRVGGVNSGIHDRRNWDRYLVEGEDVKINSVQGRKMQGFPKQWYLSNSEAKSMKLLGNSVAVDVIFHIGKSIVNYLEKLE